LSEEEIWLHNKQESRGRQSLIEENDDEWGDVTVWGHNGASPGRDEQQNTEECRCDDGSQPFTISVDEQVFATDQSRVSDRD
jgi:hypothetical protein